MTNIFGEVTKKDIERAKKNGIGKGWEQYEVLETPNHCGKPMRCVDCFKMFAWQCEKCGLVMRS